MYEEHVVQSTCIRYMAGAARIALCIWMHGASVFRLKINCGM